MIRSRRMTARGYAVYAAKYSDKLVLYHKKLPESRSGIQIGRYYDERRNVYLEQIRKERNRLAEPAEGEHGMFESMGYEAKIKPVLAWGSPQNSHWQQGAPAYRGYALSCATVDSGSNIYEKKNCTAFAILS